MYNVCVHVCSQKSIILLLLLVLLLVHKAWLYVHCTCIANTIMFKSKLYTIKDDALRQNYMYI